jgi:hypothetical protein
MEWLRTGSFCFFFHRSDAVQTRAGLYRGWIGDGRDGSRIPRDGSSCARRVSKRKKYCGIAGAKLTAGQTSAVGVGVPTVIARGAVEYGVV